MKTEKIMSRSITSTMMVITHHGECADHGDGEDDDDDDEDDEEEEEEQEED